MTENRDYVLGRSVTNQARGQEKRTSSVVSVRLSDEEMDVLGDIAERQGSSFSQVIRDAIKLMATNDRPEIGVGGVISFEGGVSVTVGDHHALSQSIALGQRSTDQNYALATPNPL